MFETPLFQVESFFFPPSQIILFLHPPYSGTFFLVPIIELLNRPNYSLFVDDLICSSPMRSTSLLVRDKSVCGLVVV